MLVIQIAIYLELTEAYQNLCKTFRISKWVTSVSYKITPSSKQGAITSAYSGLQTRSLVYQIP